MCEYQYCTNKHNKFAIVCKSSEINSMELLMLLTADWLVDGETVRGLYLNVAHEEIYSVSVF